MFSYSATVRVRYIETDQMGIVYHGHYFQYLEVARVEAIRDMGLSYAEMENAGVIMPVTEVQCRYLRPAKYDDLLTIKVILKELPLHHKIEFYHEIYNEANDLLATASVILYFLEAGTMKRTVMPEKLLLKLQPYFS